MQSKTGFKSFLIFLTLMQLCACSAGVDDMTTDFNKQFTPNTTEGANKSNTDNNFGISIYDDNFSEKTMLSPSYLLHSYTTLCIKAPEEAESYHWEAVAVSGNGYNATQPVVFNLGTEQQLNLCPAKTNLQLMTEYKLTLTVSSFEGKVYTDTATLVVIPS